jgi:hypothetical protein
MVNPAPGGRVMLYEYLIENPFNVRHTREYPLFDYNVTETIKHFSDSRYVYVGATRG